MRGGTGEMELALTALLGSTTIRFAETVACLKMEWASEYGALGFWAALENILRHVRATLLGS